VVFARLFEVISLNTGAELRLGTLAGIIKKLKVTVVGSLEGDRMEATSSFVEVKHYPHTSRSLVGRHIGVACTEASRVIHSRPQLPRDRLCRLCRGG
jgi:hypothetical protein